MVKSLDMLAPRAALVEAARQFHMRGWMEGTAGNLSARAVRPKDADGDSFWITASGLPKGQLEESDFLRIDAATGKVLDPLRPSNKPSAETAIHRVVYQRFPGAGACFHVHSVASCLLSQELPPDQTGLPLPAIEMLKGLDVCEPSPSVKLPVFDNHFDVSRIAADIDSRFEAAPPAVPALLIRGHGITVWGATLQQAYNRIEIAEFIMRYCARCP